MTYEHRGRGIQYLRVALIRDWLFRRPSGLDIAACVSVSNSGVSACPNTPICRNRGGMNGRHSLSEPGDIALWVNE